MAKRKPKSHRTGNEVIREDGRIEYEYSDGAWRFDNGHMARQHPKAMTFDSDTGKKAADSMHLAVREAGYAAIVDKAQEVNPSVRTVPEAAAMVFAAQYELATSPDMGHGSTQAAKWTFSNLNLVEERTKEAGNTLTVHLTNEAAAAAVALLASRTRD